MQPYPVPKAPVVVEETIKKSRFITCLEHIEGLDAAKAFWQSIKERHPGARHWCFAAVAGRPEDAQQYAMSDDGEPGGTAGKPMLAQLLGSGVGEIAAVVVRYSGGIKLGTGGLVKAYGGGVAMALKGLETREKVPEVALTLAFPYQLQDRVAYLLAQAGGRVTGEDYGQGVRWQLALPATAEASLLKSLAPWGDIEVT
ncbi:YigZ family protein [Gallaecimonas sp. GXIMD4217]|uniref:YigZ family protein n=1 Tax=Gallaecimonas sp. GXIMD4217 TaxID=3131927 RepID=UPI00311B2A3B